MISENKNLKIQLSLKTEAIMSIENNFLIHTLLIIILEINDEAIEIHMFFFFIFNIFFNYKSMKLY